MDLAGSERGWKPSDPCRPIPFDDRGPVILGNVVLMSLFVEVLGWPVLLANLAAVAILGITNFHAADRWVFRECGCEISWPYHPGNVPPRTLRRLLVVTERCDHAEPPSSPPVSC